MVKNLHRVVRAGHIDIGDPHRPVIIAGPCVIESRDHTLMMAELLCRITKENGYNLIFKSSYDKANRTSIHSFRGPGLDQGLKILKEVKDNLGLAVLTDIHDAGQIRPAAETVDMIQIPAFLCRQTDLYIEAGRYDVPVNIKKGQFMAPWDMKNVVEKAREAGIKGVTLTERGTSFGYNRLVVDFTSLPILRSFEVPVIFDATHAVQLPGGGGGFTEGNRRMVPCLCRAAVAVGCDGLFLEIHDQPENARSDGPNMVTPDAFRSILQEIRRISDSVTA